MRGATQSTVARLLAGVAAAALGAGFARAAEPEMDPGNWKLHVASTTNGKPEPVQDTQECLGDELKDLGASVRVATVFPRVTREYFASNRVTADIVPMSGAVEIAPHLGIADVIIDITSTGSTLRVNGLREIATVMESTARLIATPGSTSRPAKSRDVGCLRRSSSGPSRCVATSDGRRSTPQSNRRGASRPIF